MGRSIFGNWVVVVVVAELQCWVAELLFLMWHVVVVREIEAKEREIVSYNQIQ